MTLSEAVLTRISIRAYLPDPIDPDQRRQLEKTITQCGKASGLHIRLVCGDPAPFAGLGKSYGMLTGVQNYLLFAGPASDPDLREKCGYYGEKVILTAAAMGLGTCWVGGTYDRSACLKALDEGEELVCAAAIGHTPEERTGRAHPPRHRPQDQIPRGAGQGPQPCPRLVHVRYGLCPAGPLRPEPPARPL